GGRTVAAVLLRAILEAAGGRYGLVSRHSWSDGRAVRPLGAGATGAEGLAEMLGEMVDAGCAGGVLELSPETLELRRIEGIIFDLAIVTDLGTAPALSADELTTRRNAASRLARAVRPG